MDTFNFQNPGVLRDGNLELVLNECLSAETSPWKVPTYVFEMRDTSCDQVAGRLTVRVGFTDVIIKYSGQLGYSVAPVFRGRHFAERSCRLILPFLQMHGLGELWITCSPDNEASRRTIERLGAEFVETVDVPADYPLPDGAIRKKRRYSLKTS